MKTRTEKLYRFRTQRGAIMGALMLLSALLCVCLLGMLAVDIGHNVTVRTELQSAADAAALAGAQDFITNTTWNQADNDALNTAAVNHADGKAVGNSTPNTLVTVQTEAPANAAAPGYCQVNTQMGINNLFAKLVGHYSDKVNTTATAVAYPSLKTVNPNVLFPLSVSIDTLVGHTVPLYQNKIGDTVTFYINSQQNANAAYTGFNVSNADANWINSAINQQLGLAPIQNGFIPAISEGQGISLLNGIGGTKSLASGPANQAITSGNTLILPLISGDPPYNQTRPVVGFIGLKVISIQRDQSGGKEDIITAKIVKAITKGIPAPVGTPTGKPQVDAGIQNLSAGKVALTSTMLNPGY